MLAKALEKPQASTKSPLAFDSAIAAFNPILLIVRIAEVETRNVT